MSDFEFLTEKEFERAIQNGVTLVDFDAPWCAPCRAQEPILDEVQKTYADKAVVAKLNVDKNYEIAMKLGIQSIPTLIVFKEGTEVTRFIGLQQAKTLARVLSKVVD
jgi:thioredoxin 1